MKKIIEAFLLDFLRNSQDEDTVTELLAPRIGEGIYVKYDAGTITVFEATTDGSDDKQLGKFVVTGVTVEAPPRGKTPQRR